MRFLSLSLVLLLAACGGSVSIPNYDDFKNITEAPQPLQRAAKAIVKVSVAGEGAGTGSFISDDGLMLTNNHVLGIDGQSACAREGCEITIHENFQIGHSPTEERTVFAEPVAVAPELDASVFQIWINSSKSKKYEPEHSLEIAPLTPQALQDKPVNIIGHPLGAIKKWSGGQVVKFRGNWMEFKGFILPGNSGSPVLDDSGRLIGLVHSMYLSPDAFNRKELLRVGMATMAKPIQELLSGGDRRVGLFLSVEAPATEKIALDHQNAYKMAGKNKAILEGGKTSSLLELVAKKCDEALSTEFRAQSDASAEVVAACEGALRWMDCGSESSETSVCPSDAERAPWIHRFHQASRIAARFNFPTPQWWLIGPVVKVHAGMEEGWKLAQEGVKEYLEEFNPPMNMALAASLAGVLGAGFRYNGRQVADYILSYGSRPNYELGYADVIKGHLTLLKLRWISSGTFVAAINKMFQDEKLDIGSRLNLETFSYVSGLTR